MRLITVEDDALFESLGFAAKLGAADHLVEHLRRRYAAAGFDAGAGFDYALAGVAIVQGAHSDFEVHTAFSVATKTLDDVLEAAPAHWLARYLRARLQTMLPPEYDLDQGTERTKALSDLALLLEQQRGVAAQSYFASAYLLYAQELLAQSEDERAISLIQEAGDALPRSAVPFPALAPILYEPFRNLHLRLDPNAQRSAARSVEALMQPLFPSQPIAAEPAMTPAQAAHD